MRRKHVSGSAFFNKPATGTIHQKSKFKAIKLCHLKMDLIKWQLNFGSCNFGLKSYLRFQIELAHKLVPGSRPLGPWNKRERKHSPLSLTLGAGR